MTAKTIRVRSAESAIKTLERLTKQFVVFRGHREAGWRLQSTLSRHRLTPPSATTPWAIDAMNDHFLVNLAAISYPLPFDKNDRRGRLEFARHYGVPSPLIDMSYSPYIALFFAFNGVVPSKAKPNDCAAIYCVNLFELAGLWAGLRSRKIDKSIDGKAFADTHNKFLYDEDNTFANGYDIGVLKFFGFPASWNIRMRKQLGVFIYDTMNHKLNGFDDLEGFIGQNQIPGPEEQPALTKVLIPHKLGRLILERLEIMGISATHLFDNPEGAAMDVFNAYSIGRKTGYAWDIRIGLPKPAR